MQGPRLELGKPILKEIHDTLTEILELLKEERDARLQLIENSRPVAGYQHENQSDVSVPQNLSSAESRGLTYEKQAG